MMESVRVQRAMVDFLMRSPKTGTLSISRSMYTWTGTERFHSSKNPHTLRLRGGRMINRKLTKKLEPPLTNKVGGGRCATTMVKPSLTGGPRTFEITGVLGRDATRVG